MIRRNYRDLNKQPMNLEHFDQILASHGLKLGKMIIWQIEKWRDLSQSYDKSPYTNMKFKEA